MHACIHLGTDSVVVYSYHKRNARETEWRGR